MNFQPEDFEKRRRDTREETALARQLRSMKSEDRYLFVCSLLDYNFAVGLAMVRSCIKDRAQLRSIFVSRLSDLDAGSTAMGAWMRTFFPKIGFRAMAHILHKHMEIDPMAVGRALYFLKRLVPQTDQAQRLTTELWSLAREKNAILGPVTTPDATRPGVVMFRPIPHKYKGRPPNTR